MSQPTPRMQASRPTRAPHRPSRPAAARGALILLCLLAAALGCKPRPMLGRDGTSHAQVLSPPQAVPVKPFRIAQPDLVLLVTGGTNGMLEVCNCTGTMPGGLARRSGLVISYRAAFGKVLVVDSGDSFWIDPKDLRNQYVLRGYNTIGYDALVLGDQEWAVDPDLLARMLAEVSTPMLSTTVAPTPASSSSGEISTTSSTPPSPWTARRVITWPLTGAKLALLSAATREAFMFMPDDHLAKLAFARADETEARIAQLKKDGHVVFLVAHLPGDQVEQLAARTAADLIIRGHTTRSEPALLDVNGKPVIKAGGSETVAAVAFKFDNGKIADIDYRVEIVNEKWPMDQRLIQVYQAYAHMAMRKALDAERTKGLNYIPSGECGICHERQFLFWQANRHSKAYKTLQANNRTGDPNCLACHTTGFGTEKGFYTLKATPKMAGVNCQDCHRFNVREHRTKGFVPPKMSADVCTTCHTPVTDPKFDYKKKHELVRCPKRR